MRATIGRAEHGSVKCLASAIKCRMEWIAFKEELIEDLIAVLLIDVPALVSSLGILDTEKERFFAMLIVHDLQTSYFNVISFIIVTIREDLVGFAELVELFQVDFHLLRMLHGVMSQSKLFETKMQLLGKTDHSNSYD
jgi:hypothetical protein